jgi:hypothetical protein
MLVRMKMQAPAAAPSRPVEACTQYHGSLVADVSFHPVVAAIHRAYQDHRPLCLSPDIIWLLISQGFANHVNANAEALRPRLVSHQGKIDLQIRRDDFVKGSPENSWPEVFSEFSAAVREHLGEATHALLLPAFSTTGPVEKAAAEIVLLNAVQSYFSCVFHTRCGIPAITLEGTADDWEAVGERVEQLSRFGLHWWTESLEYILKHFIAAVCGHVDRPFWQAMYKQDGGSGGPYTTGWITAFFPYLKDSETRQATRPNPWLAEGGAVLDRLLYPNPQRDPHCWGHGPTTEDFPGGLAQAPFRWHYLESQFDMEFLGGFVGVRQDRETLTLRPEIGWAVRPCG